MMVNVREFLLLMLIDGIIPQDAPLEDKADNWLEMDLISKEIHQDILAAIAEYIKENR